MKHNIVTETFMSNSTFLAGEDRIHSSPEDEMTGADQSQKEVGTTIESLVHPRKQIKVVC